MSLSIYTEKSDAHIGRFDNKFIFHVENCNERKNLALSETEIVPQNPLESKVK